jgi:hypothetical protein
MGISNRFSLVPNSKDKHHWWLTKEQGLKPSKALIIGSGLERNKFEASSGYHY